MHFDSRAWSYEDYRDSHTSMLEGGRDMGVRIQPEMRGQLTHKRQQQLPLFDYRRDIRHAGRLKHIRRSETKT